MDITYLTSIIYLTIGVLLFLLGLLILKENPYQRINRATAVMIFLAALAPIMGAFGILIENINAHLKLDLELYKRIFLVWEFFFPQLLYFSFIFPRETKIVKSIPRIIYFIYLPHIIHFIIVIIFRSPESILSLANFGQIDSSIGIFLQPLKLILNLLISSLSIFYEFHTNFFALINLIYVIVSMTIMYKGYQKLNSPRIKHQVALVLWGIRVSVGLYTIAFLLPKLFPFSASDTVIYFLTILALLIGVASIAWAIIKYQFLDISLSISRGFLYSISTGALLGIYLILYGQSKNIITGLIGFDIPILEVLFIILAVMLFQPILSVLRNILDRMFGGNKMDYRNILQTLSHDILTIMDIDKLKEKIALTLTESLMLENVHLILKNKEGDFAVTCKKEGNVQNHQFSKNGEFVKLMQIIETPIGFDEVNIRIAESEETNLLNCLNCYLLMPLAHRGTLNGILCLGNKLTRTSFSAEDATLLNVLSDQIAIALENIELYQEKLEKQLMDEEISVAREIQKMLLPYQTPKGKNFEISAINIPSKEVGGDYYDFIELDENNIGIAIGDISGKGIPGAMLMSNLQATLRASVWQSRNTAKVVNKINNQIARTTSPEKYATFFYGILDTTKLVFTFTNAGHNYPIIKNKGTCRHITKSGLVVGVQQDFRYEELSIQLQPSDVIVFYTDGITEAFNPDVEEFGEQHLLNIIADYPYQSAEELRNHIYDEMLSFTDGEIQYDDLTLIVLQIL